MRFGLFWSSKCAPPTITLSSAYSKADITSIGYHLLLVLSDMNIWRDPHIHTLSRLTLSPSTTGAPAPLAVTLGLSFLTSKAETFDRFH